MKASGRARSRPAADLAALEYKVGLLQLGPDDVLVVKTSRPLTSKAAEQIREALRSALGDRRKVMILDCAVELAVLTAAELQARISS